MNYSAQKISLLLLMFLGIVSIPIGQSLAINVDFTDSESGHCYGCEDSIEQIKDHCVEKDCVLDSCIGSGSVAFYFDPSALVFSPVRVKTLGYWSLVQFQSQIPRPLYRPPIA
jgi:hypothetical protein